MSVKGVLTKWYERHLGNPEAVVFIFFLVFICLVLYFLGSILLPLLIAIVIAYLLEWPVVWLQKICIPRCLGVSIIFSLFIGLVILVSLFILPLLKNQLMGLINNLPDMFAEGQKLLIIFQEQYPNIITDAQINEIIAYIKKSGAHAGETILSFSLASLSNILTVLFYLFLVPLLAFFLLKDKDYFLAQAKLFMPEESTLISDVWQEVHLGLGNYISGKFLEALILGVLTFIFVIYYHLQYSALLSVVVGLSVFLPYIGAIVATIPLALVGLFQMGLSSDFIQLMVGYSIIQIIDGNILAPIIFSEAINIHPIIIILALILFGGLFGFWGVFFAVPLAILIKAVLKLWPGYR